MRSDDSFCVHIITGCGCGCGCGCVGVWVWVWLVGLTTGQHDESGVCSPGMLKQRHWERGSTQAG